MAAMLDRIGTFRDPDLSRTNLSGLNEQRKLSRFCDVILRVCTTEIYAHANILAAASPYFSSFLGTGTDYPRTFSQKQPQIIEIHVDSVLIAEGDGGYGEAVSKVVDYMYTGEITFTTTVVSQIMEIGKIMLMDKLIEFCREFQRGLDDNRPINVSTCTSGLQEVISLLNTRNRIIKRANVSTETDETLFAKLRSLSPVSITTNDRCANQSQMTPHENISTQENMEVNPIDIKSVGKDTSISKVRETKMAVEVDLPNMNDSPSLFDTLEQSMSVAQLPSEDVEFKNESPLVESSDLTSATSENLKMQIDSTIDEGLLKSFTPLAEILDVPLPKDFSSGSDMMFEKKEILSPEVWPLQNVSVTTCEGTASNVLSQSDMIMPSAPVSSTKTSNLTPLQPAKKGRPRGRPRGRGKGKGRRGRPPGRPKRVKDPESDPEFDEFIKCLETSENVKGVVDETNNKQDQDPSKESKEEESENIDHSSLIISDVFSVKEDPDYVPVNIRKQIFSSSEGLSAMWKSPRIRSKPLQLKRDYILHSLTKKSQKQQGASTHELNPVHRKMNKTNLGSSGKTSKTLRFVCQKCDFSTSVFRDYRQHLRSHPETDPRYFVCPKCDFKTTKSREYTSHKQEHMIQELICIYCDYQAMSYSEYEEHGVLHSGEYPYFCTDCDSRFKKKTQLMSHKPKHQLAKPFVCAVCNAGFKWKHALKNHMVTHSTTKDHLCDVCGYATAHKSQLTSHKLIHTGQTLKCSFPGCHFEATKKQKLKYHMVTHTHEKPHQCDVCGQRFSLNKNMRRHMLLHTNTRPYACKMCSFTTTRYDKLKEHNFKLHNIGEASVTKKVPIDLIGSNVTYVQSQNITLNPDGTLSEEALQTIAQLAASQQISATDLDIQQATINIEQTSDERTSDNYPIITRVRYTQVDDCGLQYLTEIAE